ncbi:MAG: dienelactone hydrolase family protein [Alphaproteobacteria bacterium]|nr:dienelactone hydrolase family protein [Alphaproteobacteria bacterium]
MIEKHIDIRTADGRMDSFVVHPEEGGPFPSVFVLMDIWGLREELYDVARRVAAVGYHVTLPNFWYRRGKVRFEYRDDRGRMRSLLSLPKEVQSELHANMAQVTDRMAMADIAAVLKFLGGEPVREGPKGTMGYCLGGRLAVAAAAEFPDQFRANASMHGTRLVNDKPDSPHLSVGKMRGEIYCGFAEKDDLAPPATIETLGKLFAGCKDVKYRVNVHPRTVHGYSLPDRDIFDKAAANRDWEVIFPMLRRQLG